LRAADCVTDHCLVVAKVKERLAVSKQTHRVCMERFNLQKFNKVDGKEQYYVETTNSSQLRRTNAEVDNNKAWETSKREYQNFSQRA
jgi:hypothetical protein